MSLPRKSFLFPVFHIVTAMLVAAFPLLMVRSEGIYNIFRRVRPVDDISRDIWFQNYRYVNWIGVGLILVVSLAFFCLETYVFTKASAGRLMLHICLVLAVMSGIYIYIDTRLPFSSTAEWLIILIPLGCMGVLSLIYLLLMPPNNYKSLFR